jgi:hypothetical protein
VSDRLKRALEIDGPQHISELFQFPNLGPTKNIFSERINVVDNAKKFSRQKHRDQLVDDYFEASVEWDIQREDAFEIVGNKIRLLGIKRSLNKAISIATCIHQSQFDSPPPLIDPEELIFTHHEKKLNSRRQLVEKIYGSFFKLIDIQGDHSNEEFGTLKCSNNHIVYMGIKTVYSHKSKNPQSQPERFCWGCSAQKLIIIAIQNAELAGANFLSFELINRFTGCEEKPINKKLRLKDTFKVNYENFEHEIPFSKAGYIVETLTCAKKDIEQNKI